MPRDEKKRPQGRPPYQANEQTKAQIGLMAAAGLTRHAIYTMLGIDKKTFTKYHEEDYQMGLDRMVSSVAARIYRKAISNDSDALSAGMFLLKMRAGWKDAKHVELTGKDGTPLIQPQVLNTRDMTPEARVALYNALQLATAQAAAEDAEVIEEEEDGNE